MSLSHFPQVNYLLMSFPLIGFWLALRLYSLSVCCGERNNQRARRSSLCCVVLCILIVPTVEHRVMNLNMLYYIVQHFISGWKGLYIIQYHFFSHLKGNIVHFTVHLMAVLEIYVADYTVILHKSIFSLPTTLIHLLKLNT